MTFRTRTIVGAVAVTAATAVAGCAATPAQAASPFDYDHHAPLAATVRTASQNDIAKVQRVDFNGAGGQRVPALLSLPTGVKGRVPCMLIGHPLTSSKDEVIAEKADDYAARGVAVFAIDARFHGDRAGIGPEQAAAKLSTLYAMYRYTVIDMRRALDYLDSRKICLPSRTGYEGRSLGGFMGSMLIGADTRIKAAVLYVSGANWRVYFSKTPSVLGGPLTGKPLDAAVRKMGPLDPLHWIPKAKGRPVLLVNGRRDDQTPLAAALALQRAAKQPKEILVFDGGHDIEEPYATKVRTATLSFLRRRLHIRATARS